MGNKINIFNCGGAGCSNTGTPTCQFTPSAVVQAILIPKGTTFDDADAETFDTVLTALGKNDNPKARAYPFGQFVEAEDKSTEAVVPESGYGVSSFVRDGKIRFSWRINSGMCLWSKMRAFNNQQDAYDILLVDVEQRAIWGTRNSDGTLSGFSMGLLQFPQFKLNDGSERTHFFMDVQFEDIAEFENFGVVLFESGTKVNKLIAGLLDITFRVTTALDASQQVIFEARTACGHEDMTVDFATELAQVAAWEVTNAATSAAIVVTTVSIVDGELRMQLDAADPNLPAIGGTVNINLVNVTALAALPSPIDGMEGCLFTQVTVV